MLLFVFKDKAMTFKSFYYFLKRQSDHLSSPLQPRIHARQKIQPMTSHSTGSATISKKIFILFWWVIIILVTFLGGIITGEIGWGKSLILIGY